MLGYGLVVISHEVTKTVKDDKGNEIQRIMPTLSDRPKLIVNRLVDIIAYLRLIDEDGIKKRYIFTRGNERFEAGSRFQYLTPKIELNYNNLVEELYKAIEAQAGADNTVSTEENNSFFKADRPFEEVINEAKEVFTKLLQKDKDKYAIAMNETIQKVFGKPIKISEATPDQQELVETVLHEWKSMLE